MTVPERLRRLRRFFDCLTGGDAVVVVTCDWKLFTVTVLVPVDWERMAVPGMIRRVDDTWGSDLGQAPDLDGALELAESKMADCVEVFLKGKVDPDQLRDLLRIMACNAPIVSEDVGPDAPLSVRTQ